MRNHDLWNLLSQDSQAPHPSVGGLGRSVERVAHRDHLR